VPAQLQNGVPNRSPLDGSSAPANTAYVDAADALHQILAPAPTINRGKATVVTTYASGHGWTAAGGWASSNVNDTTDGRLAGQMLTGTTPGNTATFPTFTKTGATALNIVGQCLRVWVKVDQPTNVAALTLRVADTGGLAASRYISWTALASSGGVYRTNGVMLPAGVWTELSFSLGSAFTSGTPNLSAITEYRWIAQDNNTAFTCHFGGIEAYPALSGRYPNGVVCVGFDDCYAGQYNLAMNVLSANGFPATIFPIIDQIGAGGSWTLAQLQQMVNIGWEVAPHASTLANHTGWNGLTTTQAVADVMTSKAWIAAQGFGLSGMFAYPLGGFNSVAAALAPLCSVARTIDSTMMTESMPIGNELQLRSPAGIGGTGGIGVTTYTTATTGVLALAKAAGALVPVTFHDISSGTSGNINQCSIADFTTFVNAIAALGMTVATYGEVLHYAMLGSAPAAPVIAANSTITISGAQNAQTIAVTPGTYPTAAGGSATVAPTTPYAHRRDTLANWLANSTVVLAAGEGAYETDYTGFKIGDGVTAWQALPYVRTPGVWTPASGGLTAATGNGAMFPSQGPPTTGRPIFFPFRFDQYAAIANLVIGFVGTVTPTLPTASFLAVFACPGAPGTAGGALLGATADFSASVNVPQALLSLPIATNAAGSATSIPAQPIGAWGYFMLLTSYTGAASAAAQFISGRLFGTNEDGLLTGITPVVYTNSSGSTMTTVPTAVPTLVQSNSNVTSWMCAK
jgi:peptidoglycan/xylan/chitin deacetylase (PgdA/CDA1 family)